MPELIPGVPCCEGESVICVSCGRIGNSLLVFLDPSFPLPEKWCEWCWSKDGAVLPLQVSHAS